mgnify:CR=1 FL=1
MKNNTHKLSFSGQKSLPPRKPTNAQSGRKREYLENKEIERLINIVKNNRHGHRDALIITMAYRHGLRVSEIVDLKWTQVIFEKAKLHVVRAKNGEPSKQPLDGSELRALRALKREYDDSEYVFCTKTQDGLAPLTEMAYLK